jgi:hypothetical protein
VPSPVRSEPTPGLVLEPVSVGSEIEIELQSPFIVVLIAVLVVHLLLIDRPDQGPAIGVVVDAELFAIPTLQRAHDALVLALLGEFFRQPPAGIEERLQGRPHADKHVPPRQPVSDNFPDQALADGVVQLDNPAPAFVSGHGIVALEFGDRNDVTAHHPNRCCIDAAGTAIDNRVHLDVVERGNVAEVQDPGDCCGATIRCSSGH